MKTERDHKDAPITRSITREIQIAFRDIGASEVEVARIPEAMRASMNIECPHCHAVLIPAKQIRLGSDRFRCAKCGKDFIPPRKGDGPPMRTK